LAEQIAERGALISEFPMTTPPDRQNFPQRNRIVSGMTQATVLVEAPVKSGAVLTVERALSQGRKVFALPGRADMDTFRGNHHLIKKGLAKLVENSNDIVSAVEGYLIFSEPPSRVNRPLAEPEEAQLLAQMPGQEIAIDELCGLTKLSVSRLNVLLMSLVLKRLIKELPGKLYKKIPEY
jgi:DNA processing protein